MAERKAAAAVEVEVGRRRDEGRRALRREGLGEGGEGATVTAGAEMAGKEEVVAAARDRTEAAWPGSSVDVACKRARSEDRSAEMEANHHP